MQHVLDTSVQLVSKVKKTRLSLYLYGLCRAACCRLNITGALSTCLCCCCSITVTNLGIEWFPP